MKKFKDFAQICPWSSNKWKVDSSLFRVCDPILSHCYAEADCDEKKCALWALRNFML